MLIDLIRLWTGPLPVEHIWISPTTRPKNLYPLFRVYWRKWLVHPLKRCLAKDYLWLLQNLFGLKVIAITGSAGKTTTKDMLASILATAGPTMATPANIDPVYNIPTTILRCLPTTKFLILEMGIEFKGEMGFYTWLARPNIAMITNISPVHALYLDDITTIAKEKSLIGAKMTTQGTLLVNPDDKQIVVDTPAKVVPVKPIGTNFFALNTAFASTAAKLLGLSQSQIDAGLANFSLPPHRMQLVKTAKFTLIDDSYNANPLATQAAVKELVSLAKKDKLIPVFVFGQMNELGQYESPAHTEIGALVKKLDIPHLLTIGPATQHTVHAAEKGKLYSSQATLFSDLKKLLTPRHLILIKGSRSWHLEELVAKVTSSA
ncbi:MAG: Mur ligase family protein [bacterium]|nr:Mur ligase family protein [bacterium]